MKSRQWIRVAAVASAMGLAGAAWANDTTDTTSAPTASSPLSSGSSVSSESSVAATIDAHTPPPAAASSAMRSERTTDPSSATSIGGNMSYDARRGSTARSRDTTSDQTTSDQTDNPAADLGTDADVNGGAGIDNPDNRGKTGSTTDSSASDNGTSTDLSGTSSSTDRSWLNGNDRATGSDSTANDEAGSNDDASSDVNAQVDRNATQGSTMTSPKPNSAVDANARGAHSSATESGTQGRFADSNSSNFNSWMSDYASQHDGRISRDEFMAQMGRRWDQRDTQHSGLTPVEIEEILVFTPANGTTAPGTAGVQPDETGQGGAIQ